ncbi:MAG: hypothetical protein ACE5NC_03950 [Anaerolineae bacterium]
MATIDHIVPALSDERWLPLSRYLEPVASNVLRRYLESYSDPGGLVVDPFCQSSRLAVEAEALGRTPVLAHFNPINVLLTRAALAGPEAAALDSAAVRLADTPKRGQPLRRHIEDLYRSRCQRCGASVEVRWIAWDRQNPVEKAYACSVCGHEGPAPCDQGDREGAKAVDPRGVHYWFVLERLAPADDRDRDRAQALLELYPPRSLYALATLIIKAEALFAGSDLEEHLRLIFLLCLERCSKLSELPLPGPWARPRSPQSWTEHNVWTVFEESVAQVKDSAGSASAREAAELVRGLAIRPLVHDLGRGKADLILTAPPSPMRTYWSLSYLWSGWLFGPEAAAIFGPLLRPRSLDWRWYARAMATAFRALAPLVKSKARMVLLLERAPAGQWLGLCLAAASAGLEWEGILLQRRPAVDGDRARWRARITLRRSAPQDSVAGGADAEEAMRRAIVIAGRRTLQEHGEAAPTARLKAAALQEWSERGLLRRAALEHKTDPETLESLLEAGLRDALENRELAGADVSNGMSPSGNGEPPPLPTHWWLPDQAPDGSLLDEVEEKARSLLAKGTDREEILAGFSGMRVPAEGLVEEALRAYGDESEGTWRLRPNEASTSSPARREVRRRLVRIGRLMGYRVGPGNGRASGAETGSQPAGPSQPGFVEVQWGEPHQAQYVFVVRSTALLRDLYRWTETPVEGAVHLIAIPDARAGLMAAKLEAAPLLRVRMSEARWDWVKWSHLTRLASQDRVDRHEFAAFIGLTPLVETPQAQLPLFR